ncbi:PH domain-containing protein [Angustibacter aerolatus]
MTHPAGEAPADPVERSEQAALGAELADGDWQRLHPLTPVVRGWKVIAAALVVFGQQRGPELVRQGAPSRVEALVYAGILVAFVLVAGVYALLAFRRARYRVDAEALQLETGVLFRQQRRARLDRLQAVDVVRPLLARIFGLAELKLEVAGGKDSAVRLSLLREDDAQALRNTLLARAAGVTYEGGVAPEAPERELLSVPVARTLESLVRSGATLVTLVLLLGVVVVTVVTRQPAVLGALVPMVIGLVSATWARFSSAFGFRVATSPDGLRLHHGLLTARSQTVPPGRVQAVRVSQPLLWRGRDWWRLQVNVAGYGGGSDKEDGAAAENVLLTVGSREEALEVLGLAFASLAAPDADVLAAGLTGRAGRGADGGFVGSPRSARWLDPVTWRRHGVRVTDDVLLLRRGVLTRQLDVVPHARTQSLGVQQGPLQRRLGLASFVVHSTRGPVTPTVRHLAPDVAARLLDEQSARAHAARTRGSDADHGRWMLTS